MKANKMFTSELVQETREEALEEVQEQIQKLIEKMNSLNSLNSLIALINDEDYKELLDLQNYEYLLNEKMRNG